MPQHAHSTSAKTGKLTVSMHLQKSPTKHYLTTKLTEQRLLPKNIYTNFTEFRKVTKQKNNNKLWERKELIFRVPTLYYLKCPVFNNNNKIMKHVNKKALSIYWGIKEINRNCPWGSPDIRQTRTKILNQLF